MVEIFMIYYYVGKVLGIDQEVIKMNESWAYFDSMTDKLSKIDYIEMFHNILRSL